MRANFFDLLKYAATGIPAPDMTAWDKARALAIGGGSTEQTLTGIPPLSFPSDGTSLISWSMKGNGQQTGTPTPDAPIMPEFVGVRTGNLADTEKGGLNADNGSEVEYNAAQSNIRSQYIPCDELAEYTVNLTDYSCNSFVSFYAADKTYISRTSGIPINKPRIISTPENAAFMRIAAYHTVDGQIYPFDAGVKIMLNSGSTALPYEPFGYKIPITCAGQTVPVYLGQTQTVRKIKKLVFDGVSEWTKSSSATNTYMISYSAIGIDAPNNRSQSYCSHATITNYLSNIIDGQFILGTERIYFRNDSTTTKDAFNAWLASEYAAGTPVTVWYLLNTPETAIINEPLCKIGDYADELHSTDAAVTIPTVKGQNTLTVDTDLQPSEMTITYRK